MTKHSQLDDPDSARFAWDRYWRLMRWMAGGAVIAVLVSFAYLAFSDGAAYVSIHMYIATAAGVFFSVLLGAALMGLVFLSSGTGHDEAIDDQLADELGPDSDIYKDRT